METQPGIRHYIPPFLWRFWLSNIGHTHGPLYESRIHVCRTYDNTLREIRNVPDQTRSVFQEFDNGLLDGGCLAALRSAEEAFSRLECEAELALVKLIQQISLTDDVVKSRIPIEQRSVNVLRKFFTFLRYRNSCHYSATMAMLKGQNDPDAADGRLFPAYQHFFHRVRRRVVLGSFLAFLQHPSQMRPPSGTDAYREVEQFCWKLCNSELFVGVADADQEFILTDACFGTLDEGFNEDPDCGNLFFPISPTVALYILSDECDILTRRVLEDSATVWMECGRESLTDVHLRNAMLLQTNPKELYFSSLRSIALSISSYDEFRWIPEHLDYSRLKHRCRQKYTQESVTKTLVIKGSVMITDLTDVVVKVGQSPVAHGSFSDVWEGLWTDHVTKEPRKVALKFLRQVMVQNVKERLLKRLKDELVTWHRLQHPNIAHLYGVVQYSNTIAMVSPWCENGTICHYLRLNPAADRLKLILEIALGVSYLHGFNPTIIHGDLKGGNILVSEHGCAVITDFGLSRVLEEVSDSLAPGSSFFAGSTRYMSPELVLALVEDDGDPPPITTHSDVWAFACVCLEIITGQLPYSHRTNDHAVTVDIMRGVKPSRGTFCHIHGSTGDVDSFWSMLDCCWNVAFSIRPTMSVVADFLENLIDCCS